jgi:hypothetical protein
MNKPKRCLINFAKGKWYPAGQERLKQSFLKNGFDGDFLFYQNEKDVGCHLHSEIPYTFKAYMFKEAMDKGYEQIIWADSAIELVKDIHKIYNQLDTEGYFLLLNGWYTGEWCADSALEPLGITREEALTIPHLMTNVVGFDVRYENSVRFIEEFFEKAKSGVSFYGAWKNDKHQVSMDDRVLGHRHDQTVASIIAWRLGMRNWLKNMVLYGKVHNGSEHIFLAYPAL